MRNIDSQLKNLHSSKPNILLIVSDDHGYGDLSFREAHEDVHTPNLDRLRKSGMLLERGYVSAPVCSPSRAGMIVGAYQERWGAKYFGTAKFAPDQYQTIPELLKTVGYHTGYFGKFIMDQIDQETDPTQINMVSTNHSMVSQL